MKSFIVASSGIGGIEAVDMIPNEGTNDVIKLALQLIIAIVTIVANRKKKASK